MLLSVTERKLGLLDAATDVPGTGIAITDFSVAISETIDE